MPYPIRLNRDTKIVSFATRLAWVTSYSAMSGDTFKVRSDGNVYEDYAVMDVAGASGPAAANSECNGIHITGPGGPSEYDEHQPYAIHAVVMTEDPLIRPFVFVGRSPSSPTSSALGDDVENCRIISVADLVDGQGSCLEKEFTVAIPPYEEAYKDRALCIGIGLMASSTGSGNLDCFAHLEVRRLYNDEPVVIDMTKL